MATAEVPTMRDKPDDLSEVEVHVLWVNAGLSCDGDSVALTSATQPSIEDLALGGWDFRTPAGIPIVKVPGCPIHPDNLSETFLYLLYQACPRQWPRPTSPCRPSWRP